MSIVLLFSALSHVTAKTCIEFKSVGIKLRELVQAYLLVYAELFERVCQFVGEVYAGVGIVQPDVRNNISVRNYMH